MAYKSYFNYGALYVFVRTRIDSSIVLSGAAPLMFVCLLFTERMRISTIIRISSAQRSQQQS